MMHSSLRRIQHLNKSLNFDPKSSSSLRFRKLSTSNDKSNQLRSQIEERKQIVIQIENQASNGKRISSDLAKKNVEMRNSLTNIFNYDTLEAKRLTKDTLKHSFETIQKNENVHPIRKVEELETRNERGRRTYVLVHSDLLTEDGKAEEPLVFVNVALLKKIPSTIKEVFECKEESENSSHCIFYSIGSTQRGLNGIELAHFLLKKVIPMAKNEFSDMRNFLTLSPIPNFCSWIHSEVLNSPNDANKWFTEIELAQMNGFDYLKSSLERFESTTAEEKEVLRVPLMRLCAHYLCVEKRKRGALDPVANFHLKNGASVGKLHWMADTCTLRMSQSFGMMVSYFYNLELKEKNLIDYHNNSTVHIEDKVKILLEKSRL
eukprot:TRINITY_DN4099_c0_g1_i1.p1 TRINITY_DN4099_c0_g1~~TRINITY_DN4099_c0_g1_i1.p1  ORF type:complete len:376 (-),score=124.44 TRINITY_DN4099_c0_g1_i1:188-1315(-)